ncbi:riboflavin synthase [Mycoplasmatota bacterium]|nr:riboflavin synthase [Mycoplasmatota bacterium]
MFTGLIEELGVVKDVVFGSSSAKISIYGNKVLDGLNIGDSISTNGVCLTVVEYNNNSFAVDVMPETMEKSNLDELRIGDMVNLERALRLGDRLGGHIVSGHVDGKGIIESFIEDDNAIWVTIKATGEVLKYIIKKGSIAIDGASLTVAYVDEHSFKVSIIPLTQEETTLTKKNVGDYVNLECDMVGKYIEKIIGFEKKEKPIDFNFLKENGFT